ncbi:uncharacterized protein LOC114329377 [Diabrotica virgifera virgifera]|uniref:Glutathione peroxidase n=1 Tax=Diabrotica virgifera virgifera TaxID=50390 RepID=A0A6P7FET4_DIAVI|nr:uncharacterized protein LOC114329377 [Diabrotica virgifera virgifera]
MPITRSGAGAGASGTKQSEQNGKKSAKVTTKKTKPKASKRDAGEEVNEVPKKSQKAAVDENNVAPKSKKSKKVKDAVTEEAESDAEVNNDVPKKSQKAAADENNAASKSKKSKKGKEAADEEVESEDADGTIYQFKANDIKGNEVSLDKYKGHVCIIVNVASKCGHTKTNYEQLVEIFDKYSEDKGLRILAFPCNQFGKQEPGDNDKICEFAEKKNVKFDLFEKIDVNGKNAHPLWKFLTSKISGPKGSSIAWNFAKFIIDREGHVVERHASAVKPLTLVENLEKLW